MDGSLLTARTEGGRLVRLTGDAEPDRPVLSMAKIDGATTWSLTGTWRRSEPPQMEQ